MAASPREPPGGPPPRGPATPAPSAAREVEPPVEAPRAAGAFGAAEMPVTGADALTVGAGEAMAFTVTAACPPEVEPPDEEGVDTEADAEPDGGEVETDAEAGTAC